MEAPYNVSPALEHEHLALLNELLALQQERAQCETASPREAALIERTFDVAEHLTRAVLNTRKLREFQQANSISPSIRTIAPAKNRRR